MPVMSVGYRLSVAEFGDLQGLFLGSACFNSDCIRYMNENARERERERERKRIERERER